MMGKNLSILLIFLLMLSLLPAKILAASSHKVLNVDLTRVSDGKHLGYVRVLMDAHTREVDTKLSLVSIYVASGFRSAIAGDIPLECRVEGDSVVCTHAPSVVQYEIVYRFDWTPSEVVEKSLCVFVTGEKQNNIKEGSYYLSQIVAEAKVDHPYIREIVISGVTTDGSMRDVYADVATGGDFAILWAAGVLSDSQSISEVTFRDSFPKIAKGASGSGAYRPYFGSLASFGSRVSTGDKHRLFVLNTKKQMVNVESATWELCSSRDVESESLIAGVKHEVVVDGTDQGLAKGGDLVFGWDNVTYQVEPTMTLTSSPTPTSTITMTTTPTPTKSIVVSTSNQANTPTQIEQRAESKVDSPETSTATDQSAGKQDNKRVTLQSSSKNEKTEILGETTNRGKTNKYGVISRSSMQSRSTSGTTTGSSPVGWRDLLLDRYGFIALFVIILFFGITVFLFSFLYKKILASNITRDLSTPDKRRGVPDGEIGTGEMTQVKVVLNNIEKVIKSFIGLLIISFCILASARTVSAQTVTSQKITNAFTMHGTGAYTGVMNIVYAYVTKNATPPGRYVISRTPDGTGEIKIGNYLQAQVKNIYYASIKSYWVGPADSSYTTHYICPNETTLAPTDVSHFFPPGGGTYSVTFRFITSCYKDFPVSDLYLVFVPDPTPTPTATPTITPTPTATPFPPFLDLPWDYRGKGLKFGSAATAMTSYFDHEYPLLSMSVVGLSDDDDFIVNYEDIRDKKKYSSHDGYDFAKLSQAYYGDPQLAAADGIATLRRDYWQMGNAIFIDHGNGFQTRYYHLDARDLIVSELGKEVSVKQGQMIGRIGYTGNVDPGGEGGAHIHFMVVYDKNHDGDFDDNIPDGLIDPYGWMGEAGADPWESAVFQYPYGTPRTGMRSTYLWKYDLYTGKLIVKDGVGAELRGEGFEIKSGGQNGDFVEFATKIVTAPLTDIAKEGQERLGVAVDVTMKNALGDYIRYSNEPFNVIIDFLRPDLKDTIKPETLRVISSSDGGLTWQDEPTLIDWDRDRAIATVDHTTIFTLVGERSDTSAPSTTILATGIGKRDHFRSDVGIDIEGVDVGEESLGIDYILYTLDSEYDWQQYLSAQTVASEGAHMVRAFSTDKSGNTGIVADISFVIDKTVPEISVRYGTESGRFVFESKSDAGEILDQVQEFNTNKIKVEDEAGNMNELQYQESSDNDLNLLVLHEGSRNGVTINYEPSVYGISKDGETDGRHEYLYSGGKWTRVMYTANGEALIVSGEEIASREVHGPLQLVTEGDKLILVNSKQ